MRVPSYRSFLLAIAAPLALLAQSSCQNDGPKTQAGGGGSSSSSSATGGGGQDAGSQSASAWFPFAIPGLDSSSTANDLSFLSPEAAGVHGRIRVSEGHFVDGDGTRVRFLGTNFTSSSCFPPKDKAPAVAAHLRKLGFNLLRFHFMDYASAGLLKTDGTLDADTLDRLDNFIAELQKNGIYANLNLKVARRYAGTDDATWNRYPWSKMIDRFYPAYIDLQKDYAQKLIGHKNPYTGNTYADEPSVLNVELNNENTLFDFWSQTTADLTGVFATELDRQWNVWLKSHYATTADVVAAWNGGVTTLGAEMLPSSKWQVQSPSLESVTVEAGPPEVIRWAATASGPESWSLQIIQAGLEITSGKTYTLSFRARLSPLGTLASLPLEVQTLLDEADWHNIGFYKQVTLSREYQDFKVVFLAHDTLASHGRIAFGLLDQPATVEFAQISLREGAMVELTGTQTLEAGTLPRPGSSGSAAMIADYQNFIGETESNTTGALVSNLRDTIGFKGLIADTQIEYGGMRGLLRETTYSDFTDTHGYWQHPNFPNGWSLLNFTIPNTSQVLDTTGGVLGQMATRRVSGYPFTVSEYNVPNPNSFDAETLPLLSTIAAFQDWDAVYAYTYLDGTADWDADHELGFFSFNGSPGKLAFAPLAALVFRKGLVSAGKDPITLTLPKGSAVSPQMDAMQSAWATAGVNATAVAQRRLQIQLASGTGDPKASATPPATLPLQSDTGELSWDAAGNLFTAAAPSVRLAVGALGGKRVALSDVTIEVDAIDPNYAAIEIAALDGKPVAESKHLLAVVVADVQNTGMAFTANKQSLQSWGQAPTLAFRVPLTLTLPGTSWKVEPLDGTGAPLGQAKVTEAAGASRVRLNDDAHPSLWFALTRP